MVSNERIITSFYLEYVYCLTICWAERKLMKCKIRVGLAFLFLPISYSYFYSFGKKTQLGWRDVKAKRRESGTCGHYGRHGSSGSSHRKTIWRRWSQRHQALSGGGEGCLASPRMPQRTGEERYSLGAPWRRGAPGDELRPWWRHRGPAEAGSRH